MDTCFPTRMQATGKQITSACLPVVPKHAEDRCFSHHARYQYAASFPAPGHVLWHLCVSLVSRFSSLTSRKPTWERGKEYFTAILVSWINQSQDTGRKRRRPFSSNSSRAFAPVKPHSVQSQCFRRLHGSNAAESSYLQGGIFPHGKKLGELQENGRIESKII